MTAAPPDRSTRPVRPELSRPGGPPARPRTAADRRPTPTLAGQWSHLVRRFGWRAYAVPALGLVTAVVLVTPAFGSGPDDPPAAAGKAPASTAPPTAEKLSAPQVLAPVVNPGDATACAGRTDPQTIVVSIGTQHAWMCNGASLALSTPVTTGANVPDRATIPGTWKIQAKQAERDLTGPGYNEFVHYWMPYDGDFGFHDATWQTFSFGGSAWTTDGSHGCVHLPLDVMAWTYQWAQVGTVVSISA